MALLRYNATLLKPKQLTVPFLKPMLVIGPTAYGGGKQRGAPDVGGWIMDLTLDIVTKDQELAWRGMVTALQGGLNSFVIGVFDDRQAPVQTTLAAIDVKLTSALAEGAVTAAVTVTNGAALKTGMFFSIADRLYQLTTDAAPVAGFTNRFTFKFLPPAREAAASAAVCNFADPTMTAAFADPMTGMLKLGRNYFGESTLQVEEAEYGL